MLVPKQFRTPVIGAVLKDLDAAKNGFAPIMAVGLEHLSYRAPRIQQYSAPPCALKILASAAVLDKYFALCKDETSSGRQIRAN